MHRTTGVMYLNGQAVRVDAEIELPETAHLGEELFTLAQRVRKLEAIATNQGGMRASLSGIPGLIQAVQRGQKIQAIKAIREAAPGMSLKEAKDLIETTWDPYQADHAHKCEPPF